MLQFAGAHPKPRRKPMSGIMTSDGYMKPADKPKPKKMEHHDKYPPSSFPALQACPCYKPSGEGSPAANRGTKLHEELAEYMNRLGSPTPLDYKGLDPEVQWAADYIGDIIQPYPDEVVIESRVTVEMNGKELTFGHADAYCRNSLFDLKTGHQQRNYGPQMAVYALGLMQKNGYKEMNIHLLYSALKKVHAYTITREEAEKEVFDTVKKCENPTKAPKPCDYCGWCAHRLRCTALNDSAMIMSGGLEYPEDMNLAEVKDPATMGKFKAVADALKTWIDAVSEKAKEFNEIDGYRKCTRKGSKKLDSVGDILEMIDLPKEKLSECCTISYSKLLKLYQEERKVSKEQAEEELSVLLSAQIKQGHTTTYWRKADG